MAIFTTADRDAVAAAIVEAAVSGFATVTIGGQTVAKKSLSELKEVLEMINADLASEQTHFGLKQVTLIPPGSG